MLGGKNESLESPKDWLLISPSNRNIIITSQ